jgi:dsDNA-specific endonuclease/ATPase MutS2
MGKLVLDLHDIFRDSDEIDAELNRIIEEAVTKGIPEVEIIPGRGTGQLMLRVRRFLNLPHIKAQYHRLKVDPKNHGRLFVYFKKKQKR